MSNKFKVSKEKAVQIAKRYAAYNFLKMQDIANEFSISKEMVSRAIYYCIFYRLISSTEEEFIYKKITESMSRHAGTHTVSPKFEKTLEDRKLFEQLKTSLNSSKALLYQISRVKVRIQELKDELSFVTSLDISDYLASEDESDYIPPRSVDEIMEELAKINNAFMYLEGEASVNNKIEDLQSQLSNIESKYLL